MAKIFIKYIQCTREMSSISKCLDVSEKIVLRHNFFFSYFVSVHARTGFCVTLCENMLSVNRVCCKLRHRRIHSDVHFGDPGVTSFLSKVFTTWSLPRTDFIIDFFFWNSQHVPFWCYKPIKETIFSLSSQFNLTRFRK